MHATPFSSTLDVVVLAAGRGLRLGALNGHRPKALLALGGETLLAHAVAFAARFSPRRIVVVTGFGRAEVDAEAGRIAHPAVAIAHNPQFDGGNLASLRAALPLLGAAGGILVANVDHVFESSAPAAIARGFGSGVTACCEFARAVAADEMKVVVDAGRLVSISKSLAAYDGAYIGLTHVGAASRGAWLEAIAEAARRRGERAVAEDVLQVLAKVGAARTHALDGVAWSEIDTPEDHARASALFARVRVA